MPFDTRMSSDNLSCTAWHDYQLTCRATDRSIVNGLKSRPSIATADQFETICIPFTVSLQDKPDMIETWGLRQLVVINDASLNPDDTDDWLNNRL